jgi:hypothetical protein
MKVVVISVPAPLSLEEEQVLLSEWAPIHPRGFFLRSTKGDKVPSAPKPDTLDKYERAQKELERTPKKTAVAKKLKYENFRALTKMINQVESYREYTRIVRPRNAAQAAEELVANVTRGQQLVIQPGDLARILAAWMLDEEDGLLVSLAIPRNWGEGEPFLNE